MLDAQRRLVTYPDARMPSMLEKAFKGVMG
jgi:hypothetical protein